MSNNGSGSLLSASSSKNSSTNRIPMFSVSEKPSSYVKLNVGGYLFYTTVGTLVSRSEWFHAMFSGRQEVKADEEGWILIDRCGKHFGTILNFLRDGEVFLPESKSELNELLQEARFFCIEDLQNQVERELISLRQREEECQFDTKGLSTIIIIKCAREEKLLLSSKKPTVKLKMNRCNNVFSYTTNSHDVLLRHIECLERYSLMFRDTVCFIRDVRNEKNEVCEWSFYYRGYQLKKIDCSSIHYSTDARLTKVEFPESKIHEEMLNLISLATRNISDSDLLEFVLRKQNTAASGSTGGSHGHLLMHHGATALLHGSVGPFIQTGSDRELIMQPSGTGTLDASIDETASEVDSAPLVSAPSHNSFASMSVGHNEGGNGNHSMASTSHGEADRDRPQLVSTSVTTSQLPSSSNSTATSSLSTSSHLRKKFFSSFSRRSQR